MSLSGFDLARKVADAVLYEGYVLYPYRASAAKNRIRYQFGVLVPPAYAEADPSESWFQQTECLVEPEDGAAVHARVRFLQAQARSVERREGEGFRPVEALEVDGQAHVTWDEAVEQEVDARAPLADLLGGERRFPFRVGGGWDEEVLRSASGEVVGRAVRRRWPLSGVVRLSAEALEGPYGVVRLRCRVENATAWTGAAGGRDEALRRSLLSAHTLIGLSGGAFVSLLDPPEWARPAAEACHNVGTFPVLVGEPGRRDVVLSSRIVLYDYPQVAPESPDQLFDATEIDELLWLRTMTLTDQEKREARATDPRAGSIIDRADALPPEVLDRLHGAVRYLRRVEGREDPGPTPWWDPGADPTVSPETDAVEVRGVPVSRGSRVRLHPRLQRADAQDIFLEGRVARVEAVFLDVDGNHHLAVTVEEDPGQDLLARHGRFLYFSPEEVEPVEALP